MDSQNRKLLQKALDKNPSCYVLITCGEPLENGEMQVEMNYQGDSSIASYLLQCAQYFIDQEEDQESLKVGEPLPIRQVK